MWINSGLVLGSDAGTNTEGIRFGSTQDTNLYRSAAGTLKTDGAVHLGGNVGFFNTAPVAKPNVTGARSETVSDSGSGTTGGGTAQVANDVTFGNLLNALASLGLITNSTTA
jgi:hypothetical protein